jgi:hypothetical protein
MDSLFSNGGHSAQVKMQLLVDDRVISVLQMGRDFLLVQECLELPATDATLVLRIDDFQRSWAVQLPEGMSAKSNRVRIGAPIEAAVAL